MAGDEEQLKRLDEEIRHARAGREDEAAKSRKLSGDEKRAAGQMAGKAFHLAIEIAVPPLIGLFAGKKLDEWQQTGFTWTIILFFVGVGAGFLNMYRAVKSMTAEQEKQEMQGKEE